MKETDLYMTAALLSFVAACIAGLATLTGPHWQTGSLVVTLFSAMFVATFHYGLAARHPRKKPLSTMEINLTRLRRLKPAASF